MLILLRSSVVEIKPHPFDFRTPAIWLGVPGGVVVDDEGVPTLFLYYTAERSTYPYAPDEPPQGFRPGIQLRKVTVDQILTAFGLSELEVSVPSGGVEDPSTGMRLPRYDQPTVLESLRGWRTDWLADSEWFDEENWDEDTEAWLVPGTEMGRVRIGVATGSPFTWGDDASRGEDDAMYANGNEIFETAYRDVRPADPMPVVGSAEGGRETLVLFVSAILTTPPSNLDLPFAWGIWRAAAIPAYATAAFGTDFVVTPVRDLGTTGPPTWTSRDAVHPARIDDPGANPDEQALDPDPVRLPDGTWAVFYGHDERPRGGSLEHAPLQLSVGDDADTFAPAADAWTWFTTGVHWTA